MHLTIYNTSEYQVPVNIELAEIDMTDNEFKIVFLFMVSIPYITVTQEHFVTWFYGSNYVMESGFNKHYHVRSIKKVIVLFF